MNDFKEKLKDFDPEKLYPLNETDEKLNDNILNIEKDMVLNLLVDMSLNSASEDEFLRAIRFSMCVIDAKKHNIDLRLAYKDQNINELIIKYNKLGGIV